MTFFPEFLLAGSVVQFVSVHWLWSGISHRQGKLVNVVPRRKGTYRRPKGSYWVCIRVCDSFHSRGWWRHNLGPNLTISTCFQKLCCMIDMSLVLSTVFCFFLLFVHMICLFRYPSTWEFKDGTTSIHCLFWQYFSHFSCPFGYWLEIVRCRLGGAANGFCRFYSLSFWPCELVEIICGCWQDMDWRN